MRTLRDTLESALDADPDDAAARAALADHLAESGNPLGEFMQAQLALADSSRPAAARKELAEREAALLKKHRKTWLGPFAAFAPKVGRGAVWADGELAELHLASLNFEEAFALMKCPAARRLRVLRVESPADYDPEYGEDPPRGLPDGEAISAVALLRDAPFAGHLRLLELGEPVDFDEDTYSSNHTHAPGVAPALAEMTRLESFAFYGKLLDLSALFALRLPRLKTLILYHLRESHPLAVLAANDGMPSLETIRIHPSHQYDDSALPRADVVALLSSPHFPDLRDVHLHASDLGDEGCREIVASGVLKRLRVLDLRHGCIGDDGAEALTASPDATGLERIDLSYNELTRETAARLGEIENVTAGEQMEPGDNGCLYSGDIE